jgi:hypothetical protein
MSASLSHFWTSLNPLYSFTPLMCVQFCKLWAYEKSPLPSVFPHFILYFFLAPNLFLSSSAWQKHLVLGPDRMGLFPLSVNYNALLGILMLCVVSKWEHQGSRFSSTFGFCLRL